jgi:hypothetical protein
METVFTVYRVGRREDRPAPYARPQIYSTQPYTYGSYWGEFKEEEPITVELPNIMFGSAASYYRLHLWVQPALFPCWITAKAQLQINSVNSGYPAPLTWFVGEPVDWPSGHARFPETWGDDTGVPGVQYPLQTWVVSARRNA